MRRLLKSRGTDTSLEERDSEMTSKEVQEAGGAGDSGHRPQRQDKDLVSRLSEMRSEHTDLGKGCTTWWACRPMIEE